jgi:hypothetical protein
MSFFFRSTSHFGAPLLVLTILYLSSGQQAASAVEKADETSAPPLAIQFQPSRGFLDDKHAEPSCGVPMGRQQVYDPETGVFHIHFRPQNYAVSAFTVTKAAARFPKPVVFRLTGVPKAYGCLGVPLALSVDGKSYAIEEGALAPGRVDKTLFRVVRSADRVTVEFTEKGQGLLKPGAQISFKVDTGW